tara:strand:- start:25 stop:999 length:975 start_codon:yes stop_codon:yes gene_type:complete
MKKIAIILGEPQSINSEIIAKSWLKLNKSEKKKIFLIGNYLLFKKQIKKYKLKLNVNKIASIKDLNNKKKLYILDVPLKFKKLSNIKEKENSNYIIKCLDIAHKIAINKDILGFINCAIDKKKVFKAKKIGVTEYLGKKNKTENREVMMLYNKKLSIVPLTTHISLKEVCKKINKKLIQKKVVTITNSYKKIFSKKPLIAVLGLNPHNDENRFNSEEKTIILPIIKKLKKMNYKIDGPFPADTAFSKDYIKKYDVILGMYHDQVLAPFKGMYNFDAINVTLGLKYLRLSPDHGVGENIIGKNKANCLSLINCIKFLIKNSYEKS